MPLWFVIKTTDATCPLPFPPLHPPPSIPHLSPTLQLASYATQRKPRYNSLNITPSPDSTSIPGHWERSKVTAVIHTVVLTAVFVLLLIPTTSTPLIHIGYLTVEGNGCKTKLGTFGWSRSGGNGDFSSARGVGYNVQEAVLLTLGKGTTVGEWFNLTSKGLIAVPIACGAAALAALTSLLGKSMSSLIWSTILGVLTCLLAVGSVIVHLLMWPALKRDALAAGASAASFGLPYWFVIAGGAASIVVPVLALVECCAGKCKARRRRGKRGDYVKVGGGSRDSTYRESTYELPVFDAAVEGGKEGNKQSV